MTRNEDGTVKISANVSATKMGVGIMAVVTSIAGGVFASGSLVARVDKAEHDLARHERRIDQIEKIAHDTKELAKDTKEQYAEILRRLEK